MTVMRSAHAHAFRYRAAGGDMRGAVQITVKAKVWCDTGCGCWLWSCWSCGIKQWVPSWALAYKFAEAHVSIWHRNGRMPATATTLPADGLTAPGRYSETPDTNEAARKAKETNQ